MVKTPAISLVILLLCTFGVAHADLIFNGHDCIGTTPDIGFLPTFGGEMGIHHKELGNTYDGTHTGGSPFINLVEGSYWSGETDGPLLPWWWIFRFYNHEHSVDFWHCPGIHPKPTTWGQPVPHGKPDPVPIPAANLLLAPGLLGLAAIRRRFKK
jgi:hypothetical protein